MKKICILIAAIMVITGHAFADSNITGIWKITSIGIDGNDDGVAETTTWKPCNEGSTITFNADGTGSYYKGSKPCNASANPLSFTWHADAQGNIVMKVNNKSDNLTLKKQSDTKATLLFTSTKVLFTLSR